MRRKFVYGWTSFKMFGKTDKFYGEYLPCFDCLAAESPTSGQGSIQFSSIAPSGPTLCNPVNWSTPGLPVQHQLPEFTQTLIHRVRDAIQPSHPLSSPSPPAPNPSQHQSLFQWVNSLHEVAKVLEFQLLHHSFQRNPRADLQNALVGSPCSPKDSQEFSPTPQFKSINSTALSLLHSPTLTSIHEYWKNHSLNMHYKEAIALWIFRCSFYAFTPSCSLKKLVIHYPMTKFTAEEQFRPWKKWNMLTANPSDNIQLIFFSVGYLALKLGDSLHKKERCSFTHI